MKPRLSARVGWGPLSLRLDFWTITKLVVLGGILWQVFSELWP